RAAECMAAELAAEHATGAEHARLEELLADAAAKTADTAAFTSSCRDFHMAIAEASHNRVLVVQLASLQYVSWPKENRQVTPKLVKHILDVHRELAGLIQLRDGAAARRLMDEHVRMIRARRVAQPQQPAAHPGTGRQPTARFTTRAGRSALIGPSRRGPLGRELRLSLDGERRRFQRPGQT